MSGTGGYVWGYWDWWHNWLKFGPPVRGTQKDDLIDISDHGWGAYVIAKKGDDTVIGSDFGDRVHAGKGDDTVTGGGGNDILLGGRGFDTAVYSGSIADFSWTKVKNGIFWVADKNLDDGNEGVDLIKGFEALQFDDFTFYLDGRNNGPLVKLQDQMTDEDTDLSFTFDVLDFDGGTVSVTSATVTGPGSLSAPGLVTLLTTPNGAGVQYQVTFEPGLAYQYLAQGQTVTETVEISVSDGQGGTATITRDLVIKGLNDAPVANMIDATTDEDTAVILTADFSDIDLLDMHSFSVDTASTTGNVTNNGDGTFSYDPGGQFDHLAAGQQVIDTFEYTVDDGNGGTSTAMAEVTINGVNDAPTAQNGAGAVVEDGIRFANGSLNAMDPDDGAVLTFTIRGGPFGDYGSLRVNSTGDWEYVLNNGAANVQALNSGDVETDSFIIDISDGLGGTTEATVDIQVSGQDDITLPVQDFETNPFDAGRQTGELLDIGLVTFGPLSPGGVNDAGDGFGVWDVLTYGSRNGAVSALAGQTGGTHQGFTNEAISGPRTFMSTTDGSEFDFLGGWFNEFSSGAGGSIRLTGYKDGAMTTSFDIALGSGPLRVEPGLTDVDRIDVESLGGPVQFLFDDFVIV